MIDSQARLVEYLQTRNRVEGLTHNFYRYPARFAPDFVREAIFEFSNEGDAVLDAFMGGGTTIVEAVANGRIAYGIDINPLAYFITRAKTTPLSSQDEEAILIWLGKIVPDVNIEPDPIITDRYLRNVPEHARQFFISATKAIRDLEFPRQRQFARCALMKLGQWALDCRKGFPLTGEMKTHLVKSTLEMLGGLTRLVETAKSHGIPKNKITSRRILYPGAVNEVINENLGEIFPKPKLVLTSPPYPGVHVLYHRWQIKGRRETPAPYWLADLRDGHGESYYTLGGRSKRGKRDYFHKLTQTFQSLRPVIDSNAVVIQLVAFSDPGIQLPAFLNSMMSAGYEELTPFCSLDSKRPYRKVPNRKWYTQLGNNQHASNEVLLVHRPAH